MGTVTPGALLRLPAALGPPVKRRLSMRWARTRRCIPGEPEDGAGAEPFAPSHRVMLWRPRSRPPPKRRLSGDGQLTVAYRSPVTRFATQARPQPYGAPPRKRQRDAKSQDAGRIDADLAKPVINGGFSRDA